jgi:tetratricopeptide (TPR) repeat protein
VKTDYTLPKIAKVFKISPGRLRYWVRTDLVSISRLNSGNKSDPQEEFFEFRDLVCIKAICVLLEAGLPLRRIRRNLASLRSCLPEIEQPLESLEVWVEGSDRVVVRVGDMLYEPDGQQVIDFTLPPSPEEELPSVLGGDANIGLEWFERAFQLDGDSDTYGEAVVAYQKCIELVPDFTDAHCNLGAVYHQQGNFGRARECYENALAIDPEHIESRYNLGSLLEEEGANEQALWHFEKSLRIDPELPELHRSLALLYEKLDRDARALNHWRKVLELDPEGPLAELARTRIDE